MINKLTYIWMENNNVEIVNLPITTQSVTSPMGLGSDSKPYKVISKSNLNYEFYLADSMQFHLELMLRAKDISSVGYITNTFRGEQVDNRHLHQFNHFEIEMLGNLNNCKEKIIDYIKFIVNELIKKHKNLIDFFNTNNSNRLKKWLSNEVIDLKHDHVISLLKLEYPVGIEKIYLNKNDFIESVNSKGEQYLINKFKNNIIWLSNFPWQLVPFYQKIEGDYAINSDLLIGIGETVGSGQRCITYKETYDSILKHKNNPKHYDWYLKMKLESELETSGFGLGLERLVLFIIDEKDIRNVQLLPRETDRELLP
ncbi:Asparaginyl-tRNA synthetase [Mycoplasmoides gallisepticum str. F]|nr:Asparaginyl-tRNA synthetase [Mycoplasmoides gallisepticum str. F]